MTLQATVGSPQRLLAQKYLPFIGGDQFQNFSELNGDGTFSKGAVVAHTTTTSSASLAGLEKGDVILEAAGKKVRTSKDLLDIVKHESNHKELLVHIKRGLMKMYLVIDNS